jgi:Ca2+-binding RTX toxin-like protein
VIDAGDGNNRINTGNGDDVITSGTGNDVINVGNGDNTVDAGDGNNVVKTGSGDDTITTGSGRDVINAGNGNNNVTSGDGDDVIKTGTGNDTINAGGGNDIVNAGKGENTVDGGADIDLLDFGGGMQGVTFTIDQSAGVHDFDGTAAGLGLLHYSNFEGVIGTKYADTLSGSDLADIIKGGKGNDNITGNGGADSLWGGKGADTFFYTFFSQRVDSSPRAPDTINDFTPGTDKIDLTAFHIGSTQAEVILERNPVAFTDLGGGLGISHFFDDWPTGRAVVVEYNGGDARVFVDAHGDGKLETNDLVIILEHVAANSLAVGDFVF